MTGSINAEELERRCAALGDGVQAVGAFIRGGEEPCNGSPAREDERVIGEVESIATIRSQAQLQMEFVADHIFAIGQALAEPVNTMAALTLLRAVLEVSARTMWLLDPKPGTKVRVARSMGIRVADVDSQVKLSAMLGESHPRTRVDEIRQVAQARGVGRLPSSTQFTTMATNQLRSGPEYSFLSGLTHSSTTFIRETGFELVRKEKGNSAVAKAAKPLLVEFALLRSFEWILWPMWRQASYLGRPREDLRRVMNNAANDLSFPAGLRFWNEREHRVHWTH